MIIITLLLGADTLVSVGVSGTGLSLLISLGGYCCNLCLLARLIRLTLHCAVAVCIRALLCCSVAPLLLLNIAVLLRPSLQQD